MPVEGRQNLAGPAPPTAGVTDGIRTRDIQDHNLALYLLSYGHHGPANRAGRHASQRASPTGADIRPVPPRARPHPAFLSDPLRTIAVTTITSTERAMSNTITVVGNITREPELRFTASGQPPSASGWPSTGAGRTARPTPGRRRSATSTSSPGGSWPRTSPSPCRRGRGPSSPAASSSAAGRRPSTRSAPSWRSWPTRSAPACGGRPPRWRGPTARAPRSPVPAGVGGRAGAEPAGDQGRPTTTSPSEPF